MKHKSLLSILGTTPNPQYVLLPIPCALYFGDLHNFFVII